MDSQPLTSYRQVSFRDYNLDISPSTPNTSAAMGSQPLTSYRQMSETQAIYAQVSSLTAYAQGMQL